MEFPHGQTPDEQPSTSWRRPRYPDRDTDEYETDRSSSSPEFIRRDILSRQRPRYPDRDTDEYETDRSSSSPEFIRRDILETKADTPIPPKRRKTSTTDSDEEKSATAEEPHLQKPINASAKTPGTEKAKKECGQLETTTTLKDRSRILMLSLRYGLEKRYSFALATDMDALGNFDDIAFQYHEPNGESVYQFLRAKNKKNINRVISLKDLLTEKDKKFSLQKHFNSFRKAERNPLFKDCEIKNFAIFTNINIDRNLRNCFTRIADTDEILIFEHKESECLKLKFDEFSKNNELIARLRKSSECDRLARRLAKYVKKGKRLDLKGDLFKTYHRALRKYVIEEETVQERRTEIVNAKFHNNFLTGYLPDSAKKFRTAFYEAYQELSGEPIIEDDFWQEMKTAKLTMSYSFKTCFELNDNPMTFAKMFGAEFAEEVSKAKDGIVEIEKSTQFIKDNIHRLAGYVLIMKDTKEEDTYYFSSEFFHDERKLPPGLENFKIYFEKEIREQGVAFVKDKYKFHITNFKTCHEAVVYSKSYLPDDNDEEVSQREIEYFFEKLVFVINQPRKNEIAQIINRKINEYFNFTQNAVARSIREHVLLWLNDKKGYFLSYEDGIDRFEKTARYCATVKPSGTLVEFKNTLSELQQFLTSEEEQVFNLTSSSQNAELRSIKVIQMLTNIPAYRVKENFIFENLSSILLTKDRTMNDFDSERKNLLIIACGVEEEDIWKLFDRLRSIIQRRSNKKIILITQRNNMMATAFRGLFSGTNKYKEMKDEEVVSLSDLPKDMQKNILNKGKFVFQVDDLSLDLSASLSEDESMHLLGKLIKGDILSKLL